MLKTKGIPLYCSIQGTGEAVLCLHGNRDSSLVFRDLAMTLAPHYQVLCADLRAHGLSEYTGPAFTLEDMVDDILKLLDEQELKQVSIIGHSLGSTLALLLSAREPDRVKKLVLMGLPPPSRFRSSGQSTGKRLRRMRCGRPMRRRFRIFSPRAMKRFSIRFWKGGPGCLPRPTV